jgi:hypothetical protein
MLYLKVYGIRNLVNYVQQEFNSTEKMKINITLLIWVFLRSSEVGVPLPQLKRCNIQEEFCFPQHRSENLKCRD